MEKNLKATKLEQLENKYFGKIGTKKRNAYESEIQEFIRLYKEALINKAAKNDTIIK